MRSSTAVAAAKRDATYTEPEPQQSRLTGQNTEGDKDENLYIPLFLHRDRQGPSVNSVVVVSYYRQKREMEQEFGGGRFKW